MTEYVLCYVERIEDGQLEVLFIKKQKPEWQKNRLNLPGGKIEPGETPKQAARRELREESALESTFEDIIGELEGPDWKVYVVRCCSVCGLPESLTDEPLVWLPFDGFNHHNVIENLNIIVPLCHSNISGWRFTTHGPEYTVTL